MYTVFLISKLHGGANGMTSFISSVRNLFSGWKIVTKIWASADVLALDYE